MGGYPEWWTVAQVPQNVFMGLGGVVELEPAELGIEQKVDVALRAVDGPEIGNVGIQVKRDVDPGHIPNSPYYCPFGIMVFIGFPQAGPYEAVFSTDDGFVHDIVRFGVRVGS